MWQKISLDPRTRLLLVICLTAGALIFNKVVFLLPILLLTGLACLLFGSFNVALLKRIKWLIGFFIVVALMQSFFNSSGEIILAYKEVSLLTTGGLWLGVCFLCRMTIIFLSATIFLPAGPRLMVQALVALKVPYELAFMTTCALSFLPMFSVEMKNSLIAIQLRGIEFDKIPLWRRIKIYAYLLVPVLEGIIIKARELSCVMEMRAFRAYDTRSSYIILTMRPLDYFIIVSAGLGLIVGIILYWGGI